MVDGNVSFHISDAGLLSAKQCFLASLVAFFLIVNHHPGLPCSLKIRNGYFLCSLLPPAVKQPAKLLGVSCRGIKQVAGPTWRTLGSEQGGWQHVGLAEGVSVGTLGLEQRGNLCAKVLLGGFCVPFAWPRCAWRLVRGPEQTPCTSTSFWSISSCVPATAARRKWDAGPIGASHSLHPGKIISIDTSSLRAAGRTGWEDLVRKCIYAFFQPQGREPSYAKQLFQEGNRLFFLAGVAVLWEPQGEAGVWSSLLDKCFPVEETLSQSAEGRGGRAEEHWRSYSSWEVPSHLSENTELRRRGAKYDYITFFFLHHPQTPSPVSKQKKWKLFAVLARLLTIRMRGRQEHRSRRSLILQRAITLPGLQQPHPAAPCRPGRPSPACALDTGD